MLSVLSNSKTKSVSDGNDASFPSNHTIHKIGDDKLPEINSSGRDNDDLQEMSVTKTRGSSKRGLHRISDFQSKRSHSSKHVLAFGNDVRHDEGIGPEE